MPKITIGYDTALERHPGLVAEIRADLAKGRSKVKGDPPESFVWSYSWCEVIDGSEHRDPEERFSRCHASIEASKGRWTGEALIPNHEKPFEILTLLKTQDEERKAERARVDALTPEQRNAEVAALLGQLRGSPGFMAFHVPTTDGRAPTLQDLITNRRR